MYTLYSLLLLLASCSDEDTTGYTVPEQIPATLTIQPDIEYQKVQGFGVMETSWQQTALTEEEMNTLFGTGADQLGDGELLLGLRKWQRIWEPRFWQLLGRHLCL